MKALRYALIIIPLLLAAGTTARAQTQFELTQKACSAYKKADTAMNKAYQQILKDYAADKVFIEKLLVRLVHRGVSFFVRAASLLGQLELCLRASSRSG